MLIAANIDEVILHLERVIAESATKNDRIGFFAALYHKVTVRVKEDVEKKLFEDPASLELLDVLFANRYLFALSEWQRDKNSAMLSKSWKIAFESSADASHLVLQHLLLGMNAHINFDLGITVVEAAKAGGNIDKLRRDYNAINGILSALTYSIFNRLNIVSPFLSLLGFTGTRSNSMLVQFSLGNARDGAWCFATDLLTKNESESAAFISERDRSIEELGRLILVNKGFLKIGVFFIRLFEWRQVNKIIGVFSSKKLLMKEIDR